MPGVRLLTIMKLLSKQRILFIVVAALIISIISAVFLWPYFLKANASVYRIIENPNGKYKIVVYRIPQYRMVFPGQAGDAPGYVRLYDQFGRVLAEKDVEMVQNIDQVYWEPERVDIKLFAEWKLPP